MPSMIAAQAGKKDSKKDTKEVKKDVKKAGKNDPPVGALRIGQWQINPSFGSIPPDSSLPIEVVFIG